MPIHNGINYTSAGAGSTVLLLHGFCESLNVWEQIGQLLSPNYNVIAVDIPGFGDSNLLPAPFSLDDVADALMNFMTALNIKSFHVVGHSMGGYIALSMASRYSDRISSLTLFQSTALPDTEEKKVSRNKVMEFVQQHSVALFISSFIPPLFFDKSNPAVQQLVNEASQTPLDTVVTYTAAMRDRKDHRDTLKTFKAPVLFIAGQSDPGIPVDSLREQANISLQPTFEIVADVGHNGMLEKPVVTGKILQKFLDKV